MAKYKLIAIEGTELEGTNKQEYEIEVSFDNPNEDAEEKTLTFVQHVYLSTNETEANEKAQEYADDYETQYVTAYNNESGN